MKIKNTIFQGVKIFSPSLFKDKRGFFFESYNKKLFKELVGTEISFVQDNHSESSKGVLRGLHYQIPPKGQGKLVRVIKGEIFDVIVDIRKLSKTFGKWLGINISEHNKKQIWIPEGFAHGFLTISDTAECLYKTTDYYSSEHERGIIWNDENLDIKWPYDSNKIIISDKDLKNKSFKNQEYF